MTGQDVDRLVQDASVIRNRGKIQATVDNARAMLAASPSLATLRLDAPLAPGARHGGEGDAQLGGPSWAISCPPGRPGDRTVILTTLILSILLASSSPREGRPGSPASS